jgi:flagellar M-ring protein FliF
MPGMTNVVEQAKQFWASRTGTQKAFLLGGAGATVLLLTLFVRLISTPDYKPLYKDLEPADAQALATQLAAQNIPHQISPDGKDGQRSCGQARCRPHADGGAGQPHSGRMGFELFDKMTWGQTEFDEKVAYQRAMEGSWSEQSRHLPMLSRRAFISSCPPILSFLDRQRSPKPASF